MKCHVRNFPTSMKCIKAKDFGSCHSSFSFSLYTPVKLLLVADIKMRLVFFTFMYKSAILVRNLCLFCTLYTLSAFLWFASAD